MTTLSMIFLLSSANRFTGVYSRNCKCLCKSPLDINGNNKIENTNNTLFNRTCLIVCETKVKKKKNTNQKPNMHKYIEVQVVNHFQGQTKWHILVFYNAKKTGFATQLMICDSPNIRLTSPTLPLLKLEIASAIHIIIQKQTNISVIRNMEKVTLLTFSLTDVSAQYYAV